MLGYSVGYRVTIGLQDSYADWVKGNGGGHAQRWLDEELWPTLAQRINAAIAAERVAQENEAKQGKMNLKGDASKESDGTLLPDM